MYKIIKSLKSVISLIIINLLIFLNKIILKKSKIIFFYFPVKSDPLSIFELIKKLEKEKKIFVIAGYNYGSKNEIEKLPNSFFLDVGYLGLIYNLDIFISNYVVYKYPNSKSKIYINHDIYDTPMVDVAEEDGLIESLISCNYIFLSSDIQINLLRNKIDNYVRKKKLVNKTKLINTGYLKLDYVDKEIKNMTIERNSILLAPTLSSMLSSFNLSDYLIDLIDEILKNNNLNIIYRPHPRDLYDLRLKEKVDHIDEIFSSNEKFFIDKNSSYIESYSKSQFLITDFSGTAYTYAFSTLNPVIFFSPNEELLLNNNNNKNLYYFKDRDKIGCVVESLSVLKNKINYTDVNYNKFEKNIFDLRNLRIKNFNNALQQSTLEINRILNIKE